MYLDVLKLLKMFNELEEYPIFSKDKLTLLETLFLLDDIEVFNGKKVISFQNYLKILNSISEILTTTEMGLFYETSGEYVRRALVRYFQ